ncbi:flagellar protein export ATPase FliI [Helicobacter sp. MIT 03-1614]|uniref:flagellar protein export ATPase FliI n=1 Tax=Helicobacter sp. MIT 03-1614 TaxID=1548147 RepID=UPI00051368F3|nr:flagellar protein export ATPase FliI [Helicobacter sp. MIT 03-1614]TLD90053.1 flagellar protein export ATPase FliI [Helicobacter sp. MIT 03-1614]
MSLSQIKQKLQNNINLSPSYGHLVKVMQNMLVANGVKPSVGDIVKILSHYEVPSLKECNQSSEESLQFAHNMQTHNLGMVMAIEGEHFFISPFSFIEGHKCGDKVEILNHGLHIPVGENMLGRVINPLGEPIDDKGALHTSHTTLLMRPPISALKRGLINEVFEVGVKSIDGILTCGKGQKMGIFAGSGVGKSTLMGMIVRGSNAPIKVIALIGERGREVPEFIHKNLNNDLTNTILVVATSDDSPLMRKYGAFSAMAIAEYFKSLGNDVLFIMDSITRFAMAQREIGLALGEPPTSKGYPPSVLTLLPQLMERAGKEDGVGSITAFFTVLVEGDDLSDPVADQSRSILDGHIVLNRDLTDMGIYPPINILNSASRVINDIISPEHLQVIRKFRRLYSLLKENEVLIRIGAYQRGADKELDEAITKRSLMESFLKQEMNEQWSFERSFQELLHIMEDV